MMMKKTVLRQRRTSKRAKAREATAATTFMTAAELAALARVSARTLLRLADARSGPPRIRVSPRRSVYRRADVERWLAERAGEAVNAA